MAWVSASILLMLRRLLPPLLAFVIFLAGCQSPNRPVDLSLYAAPVRVACVGDSINAGSGTKDRATQSYPAQLARMLGAQWKVGNFGRSGATLLAAGDKPYRKTEEYGKALAFQPDVVVIMLGTNDSKPFNWVHGADYERDYRALIHDFAALPSHPRIWICRPMPAWPPSGYNIVPETIALEILPRVDRVARDNGTGLIDQSAALSAHHDLVPDHVHPNADGARILAATVCRALTGNSAPVSAPSLGTTEHH